MEDLGDLLGYTLYTAAIVLGLGFGLLGVLTMFLIVRVLVANAGTGHHPRVPRSDGPAQGSQMSLPPLDSFPVDPKPRQEPRS